MRLIPSPLVATEALSSSASAVGPLHSVAMICAQIAIMPKNSASDASVASFFDEGTNHDPLPGQEQAMNIVHDMFAVKWR